MSDTVAVSVDALERALAMHVEFMVGDTPFCGECRVHWPCKTYSELSPYVRASKVTDEMAVALYRVFWPRPESNPPDDRAANLGRHYAQRLHASTLIPTVWDVRVAELLLATRVEVWGRPTSKRLSDAIDALTFGASA